MAIYMPNTPGFKRSDFYLKRNTRTFESPFTKTVQRVVLPGSKWIAQYTLPPMKREQAAVWRAFFDSLRGGYGSFYAFDPELRNPRGAASGSPQVAGDSQTGYTLDTDGWPVDTIVLRADDLVEFNGELKRITQDALTNGSGEVTLSFEPEIRSSPADNEPIIYKDTKVEMIILDDEISSWPTNETGVFQEKTFMAQEAFF